MRVRAKRVGAPFDAMFFTRDSRFAPIAQAASRFARHTDWPQIAEYNALFGESAPVRFVLARPRGRRAPPKLDASKLYDAAIAHRREVPTRARNWHDYLNALVWAAFPHAKLALHQRQHDRIAQRLTPGATRMPPTRTPELDALAMLDEGGALRVRDPSGERVVLFGHALYESLVLGETRVVASTLDLAVDASASVDAAFAQALCDPQRDLKPQALGHVELLNRRDCYDCVTAT